MAVLRSQADYQKKIAGLSDEELADLVFTWFAHWVKWRHNNGLDSVRLEDWSWMNPRFLTEAAGEKMDFFQWLTEMQEEGGPYAYPPFHLWLVDEMYRSSWRISPNTRPERLKLETIYRNELPEKSLYRTEN